MVSNEEIAAKVVKQLEYYFSDYNLIKDSFLKEMINKDNGWISFETLMKFNRLKQLVNNNKDVLTDVLKSNQWKSDVIEINVSEEKISRKSDKPLPEITEEVIESLKERTLHVKGFPKDITFEELKDWSQKYGIIESIEMRHKKTTKEFKGCVFIVFATKLMANKVVNRSDLKFKDKELMKENKLRYYERKREFIEEKRKERTEKRAKREENPNIVVPNDRKASALKLTNVPKALSENSVKEFFGKYFEENDPKVRYVLKVFSKRFCFVRFDGNSSVTDVINKIVSNAENSDSNTAKVVIDDNECGVEMLTKEEEKIFWKRDKFKILYWKTHRVKKRKKSLKLTEEQKLKEMEEKCRLKRIQRKVDKLKKNPVLVKSAVLRLRYESKPSKKAMEKHFRVFANIVEIVGNTQGFDIRFRHKNDAKNVLAVNNDYVQSISNVLTGEEEKNFWILSIDRIERKRIESKEKKMLRRKTKIKE